ncbi:NADP-dependent oxidoreductase [Klebsiella pneumoniae]|nr:NADP-dependent oxidoreductase [Klebsiella pneumoniae]MCJ9604845.1 NADP-dependent oxidoreductase [Klebsiella pneumoniae]MCJ9641828.1 NADP-dependent oxidoreductase [Klebsiella pneumoniae]HCB3961721.1 NADP-dependent oxidoreductase [Klebsiella pneumoniae]HCC8389041.1 NADP-dependent oxidoreductase [Klebsiella pneumoniae]
MNGTNAKMEAAVLENFGGSKELSLQTIPVPMIAPHEVLIQVDYAGVGQWDIFEREGGYAEMLGTPQKFPYLLGSEGAGTIVKVGGGVLNFHVGDKVYGPGFLNPKGGFYAEYVAIDSQYLSIIPDTLSIQEASTISGVGVTALRGLEDTLHLKKGESILIFGASGGVGHVAIQLAKIMGAKVFAVASGNDGVALAEKSGADKVIDGKKDDIMASALSFVPDGFDTALLTAGGDAAEKAIQCVRKDGRVAYPFGIYPEPQKQKDKHITGFYGDPDSEIISRLNQYIGSGKLTVHIHETFPLRDVQRAHLALTNHYVGKLCLKINDTI